LRERMSGTVTLPLPARGATLILTSGAAPKNRDAAHRILGCYQKIGRLCKVYVEASAFLVAHPLRAEAKKRLRHFP
jgi:hypothetical protein